MKVLVRRLATLSASTVVALILLSFAESRELISPRELGIAMLALSAACGAWALLIIRKSAKEAVSIDAIRRKRRVVGIQVGKAAIVVLVLLLVFGLLQGGPWLPRLIGAMVNLATIAAITRAVIRLQRSLN